MPPHTLAPSSTPTMWLVTPEQMQGLDRRTIEEAEIPGTTLMEKAGAGVVTHLLQHYGSPKARKILILCGKGNNGGDGLVVARLLQKKGARVKVILLAPYQELSNDAKTMHRRFKQIAKPSQIVVQPNQKKLEAEILKSHILIDALFGTGLSSSVREPYSTTIEMINASQAYTVAVDIPSGLHSESGMTLGRAVSADLTVTFGCPKIGLYVGDAINQAGNIEVVDIGIPQKFVEAIHPDTQLLDQQLIRPLIPLRRASSHKGTFGHAGIIAGSPGKTGAPTLSAMGCLRIGTGLVTVATPHSVMPIVESKLLEAMTFALPETPEHLLGREAGPDLIDFCQHKSALAFGPGLGMSSSTTELLSDVLPQLKAPCVLDADALNNVASDLAILSHMKQPPVLTPHPGEMGRLLGNTSSRMVNEDRIRSAKTFATQHHVVLVLKGSNTVIADPQGHIAISPTGNPGMASAGMGDVLTGIIVGLLAQGLTTWDAARAGVYLHGLAGDLAASSIGEPGLIASDLIAAIPEALAQTLVYS